MCYYWHNDSSKIQNMFQYIILYPRILQAKYVNEIFYLIYNIITNHGYQLIRKKENSYEILKILLVFYLRVFNKWNRNCIAGSLL